MDLMPGILRATQRRPALMRFDCQRAPVLKQHANQRHIAEIASKHQWRLAQIIAGIDQNTTVQEANGDTRAKLATAQRLAPSAN